MCGIIGLAGKLVASHEKVFENLLIVDSLRGKHSTGVVTVNAHTSDVKVAKQAVNALDFLESNRYSDVTKGFSSVMIGHNRFATVGKVNNNNAHPFEFSKVVGVHNGTLTSRHKLHNQSSYDTDSESLYSHINEHGIEDAIKNTSGAWALVWYDKEESTINFLRNKERPLFIALLEGGDTIAWASEPWMLEGCLSRNSLKYEEIKGIPENTLLSFRVGKQGVEKPRTRTIKETPFLAQNRNFGNGTRDYYGGSAITINNPAKGLKNVLLELKVQVHMPKGVSYFRCHDPLLKVDSIKLFITKALEDKLQPGDFIVANINNYVSTDGTVTVDSNTVELVEMEPVDEIVTFKDHKNVDMEATAWAKKYGTCSWCSTDINPATDDYALSTGGESFCGVCKNTDDVKLFIKSA